MITPTRNLVTLVASLATVATLPALTQAADPLEADRRLDCRVTLALPTVTLSAALSEAGTRLGVELVAADEIKKTTVILMTRDRPLREVMHKLADTLGYTWAAENGSQGARRYRLAQGVAARRRAAELLAQYRLERAGPLLRQIELLQQFEEKWRDLSYQEQAAEVEQIRAAVAAMPAGAEKLDAEWKLFAAINCRHYEVRLLLRLFLSLSEEDRLRVLSGQRVVVGGWGGPGSLPLNAEARAIMRETRIAHAKAQPIVPGVPFIEARQSDREAADFMTILQGDTLRLAVRMRRLWELRSAPSLHLPSLQVTPSYVLRGSPPESEGRLTADRTVDLQRLVPFDWRGKDYPKGDVFHLFSGVTLGEAIRVLFKDDSGLNVVGDCFLAGLTPKRIYPPAPGQTLYESALNRLSQLSTVREPGGKRTLSLVLGELACRSGTDFHLGRDGWVQLKHRTYFVQRPRSLDPEMLRRLFEPAAKAGFVSAAAAMAAAKELTSGQAQALLDNSLGFIQPIRQIYALSQSLDAWKLLGKLDPQRRRDLTSAKVVGYLHLSAADQRSVREYLTAVSDSWTAPPLDLELGPAELRSLRLSLLPDTEESRTLDLRINDYASALHSQRLAANWKVLD